MAILVAVCGAKITCTGTQIPMEEGTVTGTTDQQTTGCSDSILTEADIIKNENVFNFNGTCKFLPHPIGPGRFLPCQMQPDSGWKITAKGFGDTEERILKKGSRFSCRRGGLIKIEDANQSHIDVGELSDLFDNGYTLEDIDKMLSNGWTLKYLDAAILVFEFSIDYKEVKIKTDSWIVTNTFERAFVWGNTIRFGKSFRLRTLIHELMHVHQYQHHGWTYVTESRRDAIDTRGKTDTQKRPGDAGNYYEFDETTLSGTKLDDYYIEQQAEIAAHYYEILINDPNDPRLKDYQPIIDEIRDSEPDNWFEKHLNEEISSVVLVGETIYEGGEILYESTEDERNEAGAEISEEWSEAGSDISEEWSEAGSEISEEWGEAGDEISQGWEEGGIGEATDEVIEAGGELIWQSVEGGGELIWEVSEGGGELIWEVGEGGVEILGSVGEKLTGWIPGTPW